MYFKPNTGVIIRRILKPRRSNGSRAPRSAVIPRESSSDEDESRDPFSATEYQSKDMVLPLRGVRFL